MKSIFVLFLFFSFVAANGVREDDDDSGSGIALSKDTSPVDYFDDQLIAHVGDFTVLDDPGKKRMCTCPEIARCSYKNFSNSTREECSKE
jgi:hypothetical protein